MLCFWFPFPKLESPSEVYILSEVPVLGFLSLPREKCWREMLCRLVYKVHWHFPPEDLAEFLQPLFYFTSLCYFVFVSKITGFSLSGDRDCFLSPRDLHLFGELRVPVLCFLGVGLFVFNLCIEKWCVFSTQNIRMYSCLVTAIPDFWGQYQFWSSYNFSILWIVHSCHVFYSH